MGSASEEANIYQKAYQDVVREVETYAKANAIVLRREPPAESNKPEEVLHTINRSILWSSDEIDITSKVIERLNDSADASPSTEPEAAKATHEKTPAKSPRSKPSAR